MSSEAETSSGKRWVPALRVLAILALLAAFCGHAILLFDNEEAMAEDLGFTQVSHLSSGGTPDRQAWNGRSSYSLELHVAASRADPHRARIAILPSLAFVVLCLAALRRRRLRLGWLLVAILLLGGAMSLTLQRRPVRLVVWSEASDDFASSGDQASTGADVRFLVGPWVEACGDSRLWEAIVAGWEGEPPIDHATWLAALRGRELPDVGALQSELGLETEEGPRPGALLLEDTWLPDGPTLISANDRAQFHQHAATYVAYYMVALYLRQQILDTGDVPWKLRIASWQNFAGGAQAPGGKARVSSVPEPMQALVDELEPQPEKER